MKRSPPVYDIHYVVSRETDDPIQTRTTAESDLDSVIGAGISQCHEVKRIYPTVIGFYVRDKASGDIVYRWYYDDHY